MATTYLKAHHISRGETIMQSMRDRFDYGQNPNKTRGGELVATYMCDPATADAEFLLAKAQYRAITGREQKRDADVLCYQIRQAFPPGEIDAETALQIGYETAMRWTKGNHAFFVVSHTDRPHPHVHIYYNSTALDCTKKYRDFLGSARALRRLSDRVCLEHGLSVIQNPKLHSQGKYQHYGQWLEAAGGREPSYRERLKAQIDLCLAEKPKSIEAFLGLMEAAGWEVKCGRGGVISLRTQGQEKYTRLRSSTLGEGYGQEDIQAIIEGRAPFPVGRSRDAAPAPATGRVNLIIDIQQRMKDGKGPAYERWAKIYNIKQMAAALQYLQEYDLLEYAALEQHTAGAVDRFHDLAGQIQATETAQHVNAELRAATVGYAKTRPAFDGYKAARYSKKYLAEHEADIALYRSAQATFRHLLNGGKLPKMDALKAEGQRLAAEKKSLYAEYRAAQKDMREAVAVKGNIDHLLGITQAPKNKEMTR